MRVRYIVPTLLWWLTVNAREVEQEKGEIGKLYNGTTRAYSELIVYKFIVDQAHVVRVHVSSDNANQSIPLLSVFREPASIISAQCPVTLKDVYMYKNTARTLCPYYLDDPAKDREISITVELSSVLPVHYEFSTTLVNDFFLQLGKPLLSSASTSEPVFYQFEFPKGIDSVVVRIESNCTVCMTVSVQKGECPVFDLEETVKAKGIRESVSGAGAITVERRFLKKFFIIFVVRPNDKKCDGMPVDKPTTPSYVEPRKKHFTVTVEAAPSTLHYTIVIYSTVAAFLLSLLLGGALMAICRAYSDKRFKNEVASINADEQILLLPAQVITIADITRQGWMERNHIYDGYAGSMLNVAFYYGLPVVLLVLAWQYAVHQMGNLDMCWFNYRCARPNTLRTWEFFAFNNVLSNVWYVSAGALFLLSTCLRNRSYHKQREEHGNMDLPHYYGVPHHGGLNYAIGVAMIMQGILSACYHICPSNENYQFDTAFMYVMGVLGLVKVYLLRNPDMTASAQYTFSFMALLIFMAMIGVYFDGVIFKIIFTLTYLAAMGFASLEFYFKGDCRTRREQREDVGRGMRQCELPSIIVYAEMAPNVEEEDDEEVERVATRRRDDGTKRRFYFLLIAIILNLLFLGVVWYSYPRDFPTSLLVPVLGNSIGYTIYYIVMKVVHSESINRIRPLFYMIVSVCAWIPALFFFFSHLTDWGETPAQSRTHNGDCILFDYYDAHDVWHTLSALAIFASFSLIDSIDDDLESVRRDQIAVF